MSKLEEIVHEEEEVFTIKTNDIFRPELKQIGDSVSEIREYFVHGGGLGKAPPKCDEIKKLLLNVLQRTYIPQRENIVTGENTGLPTSQTINEGFVFLSESLFLALSVDFPVSRRPSNVRCDALVAMPHQPVLVLTLVDGDTESDEVVKYNTSVASGMIMTFGIFTDESIKPVYGVIDIFALENVQAFRTQIEAFAVKSALFVTPKSFHMTPDKYTKILTAFWAGVAETKSVVSASGQVDSTYLRFLTKEQCIVLVENINNREVKVSCQPGCGATTLMLEVARRLSRLGKTLLVCESEEERDRLSNIQHTYTVIGPADLVGMDISPFENVMNETGAISGHTCKRLWQFFRTPDTNKYQHLKNSLKLLEKDIDNKRSLLHVLDFGDRQWKLDHLIKELDTLKLLDIWIKLHMNLSLVVGALSKCSKKQNISSDDDSDVVSGRMQQHHIFEQFQKGLKNREDMFPVLTTANKEEKKMIMCLQKKVDFLFQEMNIKDGIGFWETARGSRQKESVKGREYEDRSIEETKKAYKGQVKQSQSLATESAGTGSKLGQDFKAKMNIKETGSEDILQTTGGLKHLKEESDRLEANLGKHSVDDRSEWESKLELLSKEIPALSIHPQITDIIGEDVIPMTAEHSHRRHIPNDPTFNRYTQRRGPGSHVHLLRELQYGQLTHRALLDLFADMTEDVVKTLTRWQAKASHLQEVYGSPVYIFTEYGSPRSSLVSCPVMKLDNSRVNTDRWHVSTDGGTLVNTPNRGQYNTDSGQYNTDRFRRYCGTCSSPPTPLPPSPSTLTAPRYWESQSRLSVTGPVYVWPTLLEMGICGVGEVDTGRWVSEQTRSSWAVCVVECFTHRHRYCTQVWGEGRQVGGCYNTKSITHNTPVVYKYGVVLDVERGRVAFLDLDRDIVMEKMDVRITQPLQAMFGVRSRDWPDCDVEMRLVSGGEIAMTDNKQSLIYKALSV